MSAISQQPQSSPTRVSSTTDSTLMTKTKVGAKGTATVTKHPVQVARRNARERNRVRQVNQGFVTLRNHVPAGAKNKKLSKVETLRQAAHYIQYLKEVLQSSGPNPIPVQLNASAVPGGSPGFYEQPAPDFSFSPFPPSASTPASFAPATPSDQNYNPYYPVSSAARYDYGNNLPPYGQTSLMAHSQGMMHKISPNSDEHSPSSSFLSDNSFEVNESVQEAKYSDVKYNYSLQHSNEYVTYQ